MKIQFGKYKKINLDVGKNEKMRPTQSMAKSIIFNLIKINENDIVLDLFAGTGMLGFESLSLGAKTVYWIDNNMETFKAIKKNIEKLNLNKNNYLVFKCDFRIALKNIKINPSIIFIDPPFIAKKYYDESLRFIYQNKLLNKDGVIILERKKNYLINEISNFEIKNIKNLGNKEIIILKYKKND